MLLREPPVSADPFPKRVVDGGVLKVFLRAHLPLHSAGMTGDLSKSSMPTREDMTSLPSSGRVYVTSRRVSIDDAAPDGRFEFDAIARFLQDAGNEDTDDAGLDRLGLAWMARRMTVDVHEHARARELLTIRTWCSGTGSRWAERRTQMIGEDGAHIEAAAIWVHIDTATGRITPWNDTFADAYLEAAGGRVVDTRLHHPKSVPDPVTDSATEMPFRFRWSDMDAFGHVNNAAYLAILEESFGGQTPASPLRVEIEWRKPSVAGDRLRVVEQATPTGVQQWVVDESTADLRATIRTESVRG